VQLTRTISAIEDGIRQGLHTGAQLYVSLGDQIVADLAFGLARPSLPMTPDTITLWLSSGKPLTAVAIAQLWEKGQLNLDDPVARFVPEFAANGKDNITLRHILTHTAPLRLVDTGWPNAPWDQIIARIAAMRPEPRWVPGRTAGYSTHVTWFMLGEIVRRLSGQPIDAYLREHVLGPCGMASTFLAMTEQEYRANEGRLAIMQLAETVQHTDRGLDTQQAATNPRPSAGVRGPIRELGRFYETLLRTQDLALRTLSNPQTLEAMIARHRAYTFDKTFGAIVDFGLGFIINSNIYGNPDTPYQYGPYASPRTFGHSGNQSSVGFADPEHQLVVALHFNGLPGEAKHQARMRQTLAAIYEDFNLVNSDSA
jgi:CubicO group peptidase (beta-lactamase class C family)